MPRRQDPEPTDFENELVESPLPVLLTFRATGCEGSRALTPVLEELQRDYRGRVSFLTVNVKDDDALLNRYGIVSVPTMLLFKDCLVRDVFIGSVTPERLRGSIEKVSRS